MSKYLVRLLLIIAIYCESVSSINQTKFNVDTVGNTDKDLMQQLVIPTASMLCNFRPNLVHIYYNISVQTSTDEELISLINKCSSLMIVRLVNTITYNLFSIIYTSKDHLQQLYANLVLEKIYCVSSV